MPAKHSACPECHERKHYSEVHDAYFCPKCDLWLERSCTDPKCSYCNNRPTKPSSVKCHDFPVLSDATTEDLDEGAEEV
jgi:hypothetical protein